MVTAFEQPSKEQKISVDQENEVTNLIKSEPIVKFQHLEDEDGL